MLLGYLRVIAVAATTQQVGGMNKSSNSIREQNKNTFVYIIPH